MELFVTSNSVQAAEALGMDTVETFQKNSPATAPNWLAPTSPITNSADELVRRHGTQARGSARPPHPRLVRCTGQSRRYMKAWKRASAMRTRILNGEDFEAVALSKAGSDDPSVRDNGGDLGWFSAFQMVYPFEEAAYTTAVGDLSSIVRTRYGYHFLEVTGRRDARGEIRAAHIMIRTKEGADDATLKTAEERINSIHDLLGKGIPWEELALKMSEDASTASKAGELPWFGTGKMVEEFENAAFGLTEDGQFSAPFKTSYGWHIVKRLEYRAPPPLKRQARIAEESQPRQPIRIDRASLWKISRPNTTIHPTPPRSNP